MSAMPCSRSHEITKHTHTSHTHTHTYTHTRRLLLDKRNALLWIPHKNEATHSSTHIHANTHTYTHTHTHTHTHQAAVA